MMKAHLTDEKLKSVSLYTLSGNELFEALSHLENCADCRAKISLVAPEKIYQRLATKESFQPEVASATNSKRLFQPVWSWAFSFVLLIGAVFIGTYFFPLIVNKETLVASNPNNESVVISTPNNADSANLSPKNVDSDTNPTSEKELQDSPNPVIFNNYEVKKRKIVEGKQQTRSFNNSDSFKKVESVALNKPSKITGDFNADDILKQYLTKIPAAVLNLRINPGIVRSENNNSETKLNLRPNGEVIRETQPLLSWNKVEKATSYQVSITDDSYAGEVSEKTSNTDLRVTKPLTRNKIYFFTVTPEPENDFDTNQNKPSQTAIFRVANAKVIKKIKMAEKIGNHRKILSIMLKEGLLGEAEKKLTEMVIRNPKNNVYPKLLNQVKRMRQN